MDAWSQDQLKKMQLGGNEKLNAFLKQYGVDKHTEIKDKYSSQAAGFYRDKVRAESEGRTYTPPPPTANNRMAAVSAMPRNRSFNTARNDDWDDWGDSGSNAGRGGHAGMKSDYSTPNLTGNRAGNEYTMAQLEASSRNKEQYFASKIAENANKPEGLPPSQGGKFVGFGSGPAPAPRRGGGVEDVTQMLAKTAVGVASSVGAVARNTAHVVSDGRVAETAAVVAQKGGQAFNNLWAISKKALATVASSVETVARDNGYKIDLGARDLEQSMQQQQPGAGNSRYGGFGSDSIQQGEGSQHGGGDQWGSANGAGYGAGSGSSGVGAGGARGAPASTSGNGGSFAGFDNNGGDEDEWGSWNNKKAPSPASSSAGRSLPRPSSRTSVGSASSRRTANGASAGTGKKWEEEKAPPPADDEWGKW